MDYNVPWSWNMIIKNVDYSQTINIQSMPCEGDKIGTKMEMDWTGWWTLGTKR